MSSLKMRKNVSLATTAQAVSEAREISTHTVKWIPAEKPIERTITKDPTPSSDEESLKPNNFTLRKSEEIKDGAKNILPARTKDLQIATRMHNKFFYDNPYLDQESTAQIKEKFSVIKDHSIKAKKYSDWTTARNSLLQGNKELAKKLEETGYSIGSDWSQQQLQEDWGNAQQEPWATNDALFDLQKTIAAAISKKPSNKSPLPQQTLSEQEQPELHKETYTNAAHESHEDIVSVPGVGLVDRNKYDIGNVTYDENGKWTIFDMTGRRYDQPEPPSNNSSCTIS
ncbi:MAG: hypothetical protein NT164_04630 [Verrucomicrobiae bacterium]|nr:hypothetical protein [Verrucomicrobiae bacterium]